jgi:hypothetical protein
MARESTDKVAILLAGWRQMSHWERNRFTEHPGHRKWNSLVDKLNRIAEAAAADPEDVQAIRSIAEHNEDPSVRLQARWVIRPDVPRPDSDRDLRRWMEHPLVGVIDIELAPRIGVALVPPVEDGAGGFVGACSDGFTWLLGEPAAGLSRWPRRDDDVPLAHLAQVELKDQLPPTMLPSLPREGVLQFFHDLEAIGDDPVDGKRGAWLVHYLPHPSTKTLSRPEDLGEDAFRPRQFADDMVTWTFPSSLGLDLTDEEFERVELANERVLETVHSRWGAYEKATATDAVPMMFGYGAESRPEAVDRLGPVLPLQSADDRYVLLVDIPGAGPFDGWIGDMGHLEFWIRDSDLKHRHFDRAWALLR